MNRIYRILTAITLMLALAMSGCSDEQEIAQKKEVKKETSAPAETRGEHDRDDGEKGKEKGGEKGEESGDELALDEKYDTTRNGARLILVYDAKTNSFNGTVQNTTKKTLERVRVEVHTSNGKELGPTMPVTLEPGNMVAVRLPATSKDFDKWSAHPEVGNEEHGGEGRGEGRGEHR